MAYGLSGEEIELTAIELPGASGQALARAVELLEKTSFAAKLAAHAGQPLSRILRLMPRAASGSVNLAVEKSLAQCLQWAIHSMEDAPTKPSRWRSSAMVGLTGGLGGALGFVALPIELPLTTTLMLRGIAEIGRHHGEDLKQAQARLACMEVFALGGGKRGDPRLDIGYWATRTMFARLAGQAVSYAIERGVGAAATPIATSFVAEIATRYGMVVSEKVAAGSLPLIGAVGGATINMMFMDHFQNVAEGHFIVRRLERRHGRAAIERAYGRLANQRIAAKA